MGPGGRRHRHHRDHRSRPAELGDIVYVDLPKPGTRVEQGRSLGSVESVKAVSDIYSPVSGEVAEINPVLADAPEKLNEDPHGAAWLVKIRLSAAGRIAGTNDGRRLSNLHRSRKIVALPAEIRFRTPPDAGHLRGGVGRRPVCHLPEAVRLRRPLDLAPGIFRIRNRRLFPRAGRRKREMDTHRSSAPASTAITARCWWMRWFRAVSF